MTQEIIANRRRIFVSAAAVAVTSGASLVSRAHAKANGISALVALVQEKTQQANEEALGVAEIARRQRDLVDSKDAKGAAALADEQIEKIESLMKTQKEIDASLEELAKEAADLNCK